MDVQRFSVYGEATAIVAQAATATVASAHTVQGWDEINAAMSGDFRYFDAHMDGSCPCLQARLGSA